MNKFVLTGRLTLTAFLISPAVTIADDPATIIVTASRGAETVDETLAPVTVISRSQIESSGADSVAEVLTAVPGLVVSNNGGPGKTTSVFLRGTESDHVLVLIDGVKIGAATSGTAPFQDLPLSLVEKIEVVRGPRSSLYGSDAIGGVIQIFTRKGGNGTQPILSVSAGSHGFHRIQGGISGGDKAGWYSIVASNSDTDGFNACRAAAGCGTVEPDDDGYSNTAFSFAGGGQITDRLHLEGNIVNSDNETEFDGSYQNESETATGLASLSAGFQAAENWQSNLIIAQTRDDSDNFLNGVFASNFDTERRQLTWLNDILAGRGRIITGFDYIDDEIGSNDAFTVSERDNAGIFATYSTSVGSNDFEFSLRNDDNEQFGSKTTGGVAFGRNLDSGVRVTVSYGTAFKAPTFNELYFPGFGNPDLEAETSKSIDLGLSGHNGDSAWAINIYRTEIDDLIGFDPITFSPVNIDEAKITGIEFTGSVLLDGWTLTGNLALQDPEDAGGGINDGNRLPRRARRILRLDVDKSFAGWSFGGSLYSVGGSFDDLGNTARLDRYTVVNARAEYKFKPHWAAGFHINNLFDEDYETAEFYNQDGMNGTVTIRYIPE